MNTCENLTNKKSSANEDIAYWQHHIKQANKSKLSRAAYCRKQEINCDRLAYWHKKLTKKKSKKLIPVKVATSKSNTVHCVLELASGARLMINDSATLNAVLKA